MPDTLTLSATERVGEAMRRSLPLLPGEARGTVEAMLQPEALAIVAGTLVVWAGSHFFGVGEVVDIILLVVGFAALGMSVFSGAGELSEFTTKAVNGRTSADLDEAAGHFAKAVMLLGISAIQAMLLRGAAKPVVQRGMPRVEPLPDVGTPPPAGNGLSLSRPRSLPGGELGGTTMYGEIAVSRAQSLSEQKVTLFHELVHRYFSPRTGPLRQLRAQFRWNAYSKSSLLRYLEEAMAEGYGQLRVHGLSQALGAYRFPIQFGYVTVSQMRAEGMAIGTISLGGTLFWVGVSDGPMPTHPRMPQALPPLPPLPAQPPAQPSSPRLQPRARAMIDEATAIGVARRIALQQGWAFVEPVQARLRKPWFFSKQSARWEIESNAVAFGARARFVIDAEDGTVLEKGYVPR